MKAFAVIDKQVAMRRVTEPYRLVEHRVEYRGQVARGAVDDAQHFGGCCLLIERLFKFGGALFYLLLELGIGFLEVARHAIELSSQALEFVPSVDLNASCELAGADPCRAGLQ